MRGSKLLVTGLILWYAVAFGGALERMFDQPPDAARPWVYWYFMDGNMTREGMKADLEAMKAAGIGGVLILEVGLGNPPRGPVEFLSEKWLELFGFAIAEADRLGIEVAVGTGPGWCGTGGKAVKPEDAMQHTVASETTVEGPAAFSAVLPLPDPRKPFFGEGTLTPEMRNAWQTFYRDVAVLAFPDPKDGARLPDTDEKALYYRAPFSSQPGVKPHLWPSEEALPAGRCVDPARVVDLTGKMDADGRLTWQVPEGRWTVLRVGRRLTGQTTRPAPKPGLGFETDKFTLSAVEHHLRDYADKILAAAGEHRKPGRGLTRFHFDSWEMSSQNGSETFLAEFHKRRGYSPLPYLPAINGRVVGSSELTERFLWDWRMTAQELVIENHLLPLKAYAHRYGLAFSSEPYDMNPCCDIASGTVADVPMCEFWSKGFGFNSEYSCLEAVSVAHTMGRPVVGAEAFTASDERWRQYPGAMKAQGDWALCFGINGFTFHTYQHQPSLTDRPGMTMGGFYGVNWHRNQTWWPMVESYHRYLTRCQAILRQGEPVADILYLLPEGAPMVFQPPPDALMPGTLPDRRGYAVDGCAPGTFLERARFENGRIRFGGGAAYRALVLPRVKEMTPTLLEKVVACAEAGIPVFGSVPRRSPSLVGYPACDTAVAALGKRLAAKIRRVDGGSVWAAPITRAKWIWTAEVKDLYRQPTGERWFTKTFTLDSIEGLAEGHVLITADNDYRLWVNGTEVGTGDDFHRADFYAVGNLLKAGPNTIKIAASNWTDTPNPAGLIAAGAVVYADGREVTWVTDESWTATRRKGGQPEAVQVFGGCTMRPWGLNPKPSFYPAYAAVARALAKEGLPADFESDGDVRSIHRRVGDQEVYFVGNRTDRPQETVCRFRVADVQSAAWWDPVSGERRALPVWKTEGGVAEMPLAFGAGESGFVVFTKGPGGPAPGGTNRKVFRTLATLEGAWQVAFDPAWGGPETPVTFASLEDWTKRPEWGIRHYSGIAVYRKTVTLKPNEWPTALSLGSVANLARVRLNGRDLGSVWCPPWRVAIPDGLWKPDGNEVEIEVANLWKNRLVGDAALPKEKQFTRTTRNPYGKDDVLAPSGLFGPVTLESE